MFNIIFVLERKRSFWEDY